MTQPGVGLLQLDLREALVISAKTTLGTRWVLITVFGAIAAPRNFYFSCLALCGIVRTNRGTTRGSQHTAGECTWFVLCICSWQDDFCGL